MTTPLHVGIEHPNALWLLATALLAFVVGGLAMRRSSSTPDEAPSDLDTEETSE